jgi:hypothetical protein
MTHHIIMKHPHHRWARPATAAAAVTPPITAAAAVTPPIADLVVL